METGFWWENVKERDHLEDLVWVVSIKIDLRCEGVNGRYLAEDRDQWLAVVNRVMDLWTP
jgi:hypothetical protein